MRGYPKGTLSKRDFENLLEMPEHKTKANAELQKLAAVDDRKIMVDRGTENAPKLVQIDNPMPVWKRMGYRDKMNLVSVAVVEVKQVEGLIDKL